MLKLTSEQSQAASSVLERMDKIAGHIQAKVESGEWKIPFDEAQKLVNAFDGTMDATEVLLFGEESLQRRQAEVLKTAGVIDKEGKVFQQDSDEKYMGTFENTQGVVQADADEPYMGAYSDDQSSAVRSGKDAVGSPLTPHS